MSIGNIEEIDSLMEMLAGAKAAINERTIRGNVILVAGEMPVWVDQFSDVFKHPLQAIGPALWLVGRWAKMGFCSRGRA